MSAHWIRSPHVASEQVAETVYVLDLSDPRTPGVPVALEGPGTSIWLMLGTPNEPRPLAAIVESLAREYDVPPEDLEVDVLNFLTQLESQGFVLRVRGGNGSSQP